MVRLAVLRFSRIGAMARVVALGEALGDGVGEVCGEVLGRGSGANSCAGLAICLDVFQIKCAKRTQKTKNKQYVQMANSDGKHDVMYVFCGRLWVRLAEPVCFRRSVNVIPVCQHKLHVKHAGRLRPSSAYICAFL